MLDADERERERIAILAAVGHELRTPVTSICGYIETLLDGGLDERTGRRFLETAHREALRLGRLVEGMLAFSLFGLTAARDRGHCDVVEQIRAVAEAVAPLAAGRRIRIRTRVPASASARIDGDACVHALANLAENAIKYGYDRGIVVISCVPEAAFVRVTVDDDGPGIVPAVRQSIFNVGVRGAHAQRTGSGIGLAVVRAIAQYAGGTVSVESSALGGARFIMHLPAG